MVQNWILKLKKLDATAWRTLAVGFMIIVLVSILLSQLAGWLGIGNSQTIIAMLDGFKNHPFAIFVVIAIFTLLGFLAVPQFLLIAVTVAVFGPITGFFYAWIATLISAAIEFGLAKYLGKERLKGLNSGIIETIRQYLGHNGFWASFIVRIVPSAPFIVVNTALGISAIRFREFMAGTALGTLPKTALVALLGDVFLRAQQGDWRAIATLVAAVILWLAVTLAGRYFMLVSKRKRQAGKTENQVQSAEKE